MQNWTRELKFKIFSIFMIFYCLGLMCEAIYLPALPSMAESFGSDVASLQHAFSSFFLGYGSLMLIYGPLSDFYGRRMIMITGIVISIFGCYLAIIASELWIFKSALLVMGFGMGASGMLCRTLSRDLFKGNDLILIFNIVSLSFVVIPILAPILGGYLVMHYGWRSIFILMLNLFIISFFVTLFFFKETKEEKIKRTVLGIIRDYAGFFKNGHFTHFAFLGVINGSCIMCFESAAAFIFQGGFGMNPIEQSIYSGIPIIGLLVGILTNPFLTKLMNIERTLLFMSILASVVNFLFFILAYFNMITVFEIVLLMLVLFFTNGVTFSLASSRAMSDCGPDEIGLGGALLGSIHNCGIALAVYMMATFQGTQIRDVGFFLFILSLLAPLMLIDLSELTKGSLSTSKNEESRDLQ